MRVSLLVLFGIVCFVGLQAANAQSVSVSTSKTVYNYGDYLSVTINVSDITGDNAVMYIVDLSGVKSSPIPVVIKNRTTTITTPVPFNFEIFPEGKYQIELEYDGEKATSAFSLVDAGNIVMPFGSNVIVVQWSNGAISDYLFFKFLVEKGTISLPEGDTLGDKTQIPYWYRANGVWWSEQKITDEEFVNGLQYLVDRKFVEI